MDVSQSDFVWKGSALSTVGELTDALAACATPEEAIALRDGYRLVNEHADENLGYLTGYLDADRGAELRKWISCPHPIFGMGNPSALQAFTAGIALGMAATDAA